MLTAGLAFTIVNSFAQVASIHFGVSSTTFALFQYAIAFFAILPYLRTLGIRQSLRTNHFGWHALRIFLAVIGIQLWLWALAYPVPIWQGIALLMTSPLFATIGSGIILKEKVGAARWVATLTGFIGAMIILEHGQIRLLGPLFYQLGQHSFGLLTPLWLRSFPSMIHRQPWWCTCFY